ncbi:MAG TPA: DinB family protein [Chthonomonadaceae bacterium]|nr:DinB family protein [Chthonomonadaceae bacterium]
MITPAYATTMAQYNKWMNESQYRICAELTDEERKGDRGASYRSIHGTLNHLLLGDRLWMGRLTGTPFAVSSLDAELYHDFEELRREREKTDQQIEEWMGSLTEEALSLPLRFTSLTFGREHVIATWVAVVHFFNHQTHHRGQLTTLLHQIGTDFGLVDLVWLPGIELKSL